MATPKAKGRSTKKVSGQDGQSLAAPTNASPGGATEISKLQQRVADLETKLVYTGFDCFHVIANAKSLAPFDRTKRTVRIDHPLANGEPSALLFAQPLIFSSPVVGFGYSPEDKHWYMQLSPYKAVGADWGRFKIWENGVRQQFYMWEVGTPEEWQKTGGNARLVPASAPNGESYFVAVYIPKAPIPPWAKAATQLKSLEVVPDPMRKAKSTLPVKPKTVPERVLEQLRLRPK